MTRTKAAERPRTRFVWDELLSHKVPRALRVLGFNTTYVGASDDGAPPRQATDAEVIEFAKRTNQVIVTSNHDMMLLCHEAGQPFVWIDPRGRQLQLEEQVLLCFRQVRDWDDILASGNCVHAMRTKAVLISSAEAARLATTASSISARHINESEDGAAKRDRLNVLLPGLPPSTLASMGEVRVRRAGATTVSSTNRSTIPEAELRAAGLSHGDRLVVRATGPGRLLLERQHDVLADFAGSLTGVYGAADLDTSRDEWA